MKIAVVMKLVPDVVEEIVVSGDGQRLDRAALALKTNEFDEQALEQGLLLKEAVGAQLVALAAETGDVEETLASAVAKGADSALKLVGEGMAEGITSEQYAAAVAPVLQELGADVVLCGVQANDDLDGQLATWIAAKLGWSFATVVAGIEATPEGLTVRKEFAGGLSASLGMPLPAVIGVQASPKPPRYAPISRVRQIMKTQPPAERQVSVPPPRVVVTALTPPEQKGGAEMVDGGMDAKVTRLIGILQERGIV